MSSLLSVLNDQRDSIGNTSPQRTHKRTQATPSAPLQATENTDQQSPLDDDGDDVEPQVLLLNWKLMWEIFSNYFIELAENFRK
jgi:hypothetical protein